MIHAQTRACRHLASASRGVQRHCVADESLEGGVVNFVAFVRLDGTPDVAFKAGVEELRRIPRLSTLGECQLDHVLGMSRPCRSTRGETTPERLSTSTLR